MTTYTAKYFTKNKKFTTIPICAWLLQQFHLMDALRIR